MARALSFPLHPTRASSLSPTRCVRSWADSGFNRCKSDSDSESDGELERNLMLPLTDGGSFEPAREEVLATEENAGSPPAAATALPSGGAPRLDALDAPRWIAATLIVCGHFYEPYLGSLASWGSTTTQFFFILSGFLLAYVEMARPSSQQVKMGQLRYLQKRLIAIYPTYMFTIVLSMFQFKHSLWAWVTLPLNVLLLQAWLPLTWPGQTCEGPTCWGDWLQYTLGTNQWAGTAWFMSVLVFYWLLLRPIQSCTRHLSTKQCTVAITACWLWSFIVGLSAPLGRDKVSGANVMIISQAVQFGPLGYLHVFVCGIVGARLFVLTSMRDAVTGTLPTASSQRLTLDTERTPLLFRFGCCIGCLTYVALVILWPDMKKDSDVHGYTFWTVVNGGLIPVMLLIIIGAALGQDPIAVYVFQNRYAKSLGRISYAQYLLQINVHELCKAQLGQHSTVADIITFPFLLVLSYCVERFFTRINTEWYRWRQEKGQEGCDERMVRYLDHVINRWYTLICCRCASEPQPETEVQIAP